MKMPLLTFISHDGPPWSSKLKMKYAFSSTHLFCVIFVALITQPHGTVGFFWNLECWFTDECCQKPSLKTDIQGLRQYLTENLHGQHLVVDPIVRSVGGHLRYDNPKKALALSLHGSTGTGKNFVSKAIAEHLFQRGMDSQYVHLFAVTLDFPHISKVELYQDQLKQWIIGNTTACHRNLFIFDEVHEMPPGVIDAIKPFLDHHQRIGGIDYRKNIFIFLGNTAGKEINNFTLNHWQEGKLREDITLKELQPVITKRAFNEHGGLWHSRLIDHSLINSFIPFLPMERKHVEQCVLDDLRWKRIPHSVKLVNSVLEELEYKPEDLKLYAKTGCKPVSDKVNLLSEEFGHTEL